MSPTLIYIHGQYGSPDEAEREFAEYFDGLEKRGCGSIGATLEVMPGGEHHPSGG